MAGVLASVVAHPLCATAPPQGLTTVAVSGTIAMADGSDSEGARVIIRNGASGFAIETGVRRGQFLVQGLEAGGPYTIMVRRIGAVTRRWDGVFLTLGAPVELHVTLEPAPVQLDSVVSVAVEPASPSPLQGGTATTLPDSLIHRLPSLNRNVYDFLRLVPQLSTRIGFAPGGISGGGVGFRFNQFLTNGVPERSLAGGQPQEFAGGKSLPMDAVREYQVLVAPFDARFGDFAGAMVNTVSRSGSNVFEGSVFAQGRSDALARGGDLGASPYERWQYGIALSGPIIRDRAQFLIASELQRQTSPMVGPFVGQASAATPPVPLRDADLARLDSLLQQRGLEAGSGGPVANWNRLRNLFVRLDAGLPALRSRAVLWMNDSDARSRMFSRQAAPDTFLLSTHVVEQAFTTRTFALQLYTTLPRRGGGQNELSISRRSLPFQPVPTVNQPLIRVAVPSTAGGITTVVTGTPVQAQGGVTRTWDTNLRDDFTVPLGGKHVANAGFEAEWFHVGPAGVKNVYGTWAFASLDSLQAGLAERYEVARDFGSGELPITGGQFAAYLGDSWRAAKRVSLTLGLRAEWLSVAQRAPYNPTVDALFGRRTDAVPLHRVYLSPRIGFTWNPGGLAEDRVRGGIGIFSGRPPLAWLHVPLQNYGEGIGTLRCGTRFGDLGLPPPFEPDPRSPPDTCAGGGSLSGPPRGDVELVDRNLQMARTLRAVLAYERQLPGRLLGTIEALVTRNLTDFAFVNLNLVGPQSIDRFGRVLYGSVDTSGRAVPARVADSLPSVIEMRNVSHNHSAQVSVAITRQFAAGFSIMASYTWSRVRDAQTPLRVNTRGIDNWALRAVSGYHDDLTPGISLNDVPHRVVVAGTWRAPWPRWLTEVSLLYVGESGSPFTYRAGGAGGRGDLNADGALNDPVYVPRSALDPAEIVFSGISTDPGADNSAAAQAARIASQRNALEQFMLGTPCLRRQRGHILERNSCREPWTQTTAASLRQMVPLGERVVEVQLDVFNVLNLLHSSWGRRRLANPVLLEQVGETVGTSGQQEPVFRFSEPSARWSIDPVESAFQLQLGLRYRF
jgi:hypothetical protein